MAKNKKSTESNTPQDDFNKQNESQEQGGPSTPIAGVDDAISSAPEGENDQQFQTTVEGEQAPTDMPPLESQTGEDGFGAVVWHENKQVNGLWSKNETRNSWASISGLGWKKIHSANDTSCVALTILAAHAQSFNKNVKVQLDNEQIKEMYVW